jgi:predicted transcriptional regulator
MRHVVLSEGNLEIMKIVWAEREATVNRIWGVLNETRRRKVRRTTVQVQMRRLEKYGWLRRRKVSREFVYAAPWDKSETVAEILHSIRRRLFDGSHAEMVGILLTHQDLSAREWKRIAALIRARKRETRSAAESPES